MKVIDNKYLIDSEEDMKRAVDEIWEKIHSKNKKITKEQFLNVVANVTNLTKSMSEVFLDKIKDIDESIDEFSDETKLDNKFKHLTRYSIYMNVMINLLFWLRDKYPEIYYNLLKVIIEDKKDMKDMEDKKK